MILEAPDGSRLKWQSKEWMAQQFDPTPVNPFLFALPYLDAPPKWVVLGGLGDLDDGRQAAGTWPGVNLIGVDPDPRAIAWQRTQGEWPEGAPLYKLALSIAPGIRRMDKSTLCCASLHKSMLKQARPENIVDVECTTLDMLDSNYGPLERCIIWLDCEGCDHEALIGGLKLLESGRALLVNFEVKYELPSEAELCSLLLKNRHYEKACVWGRQWWGHNEIWRRK